jgi:hypothetical protein
MSKKKTTEQFIEEAIAVHGDKYEYSYVEYNGAHKKVKIFCIKCDKSFWQIARDHLKGKGCYNCGREQIYSSIRSNKNEFIERVQKIHGEKYDYSSVEYINANTKVKIWCFQCNDYFWQIPYSHIIGIGCAKCGGVKKLTLDEFISKSFLVHGDTYEYSDVEYKGNKTKVKIWCFKCEKMFWQIPNHHLRGVGCPRCCLFGQSKKAIRWLEIMQNEFKDIEHAKNKGEFRIPGTNFKADGWCPSTKTIFEFQGCYWHGCLCFEDRNEINERTGKTMQQLYEYTMERERIIKELGYNIVSIWECEFDEKYN